MEVIIVKKVMLNEMSWTEFNAAMAKDDLIIFPVGSMEEHGPHNPLGTDFMVAEATARAIGERTGAVVAPVMPIGNADNLMEFPGTASIDYELLKDVLVQSCENLIRHGAKKFLFINGHGGNTSTIKMVSAELFAKHKIMSTQTEWWVILPQISDIQCNDHGGKHETSVMLYLNENIVDMSKANTVERKNFTEEIAFDRQLKYKGAKLNLGFTLDAVTEVGNYGARAEEATKEFGERIVNTYVDYCVELVEELRKVTL